jgi:hypothetical protein
MLTACQKIKKEILLQVIENYKDESIDFLDDKEKKFLFAVSLGLEDDKIDKYYSLFSEYINCNDYENEFRPGTVETEIPCDYSRHYESKSVATKLSDGSWVGWCFWYGGGKHGCPEEIEWMEDAYDLDVTETEKLVLVREFKKKE